MYINVNLVNKQVTCDNTAVHTVYSHIDDFVEAVTSDVSASLLVNLNNYRDVCEYPFATVIVWTEKRKEIKPLMETYLKSVPWEVRVKL